MAVTYANYTDFTAVYSVRGVSETEINSYWLSYGALRTNEALGGYFTVPFSSNNDTAKDLSIYFAYLGILDRQKSGQVEGQRIRDLNIILYLMWGRMSRENGEF